MKLFFKLCVLSVLLTSQSCIVTKKKFDDMLAQKVKAEGELYEKAEQLDKAEKRLQELDKQLAQLAADTTALGEQKRLTQKQLAELNMEYDKLNAYYKNLMTSSGKMNRDLIEQRDQLFAIQENLDRTRKLNDSLSVSLMERERKVKELEGILARKDKAVQDLKKKINDALLGFKESDLTVTVKNGKVYVSLAEQLLFKSGSVVVDDKGESALRQLAVALKDHKDVQVMVEGHTDNVPIGKKSQYMQDNWDLSVMRATSITRILVNAGVKTTQILPSGKGEYAPLMPNTSDANRQKNRRTEIIVTPHLDELFKILEAN
ncbi:MAG: OmpA family protein [Cyclobacteriaceae bacterium]|nr:OmpA family protein [Cyclobacteriaceae bacterium]